MNEDGRIPPMYFVYHDKPLHVLWVYRDRDCILGPFEATMSGYFLCSEIVSSLALGPDFDGKLSRKWGEA